MFSIAICSVNSHYLERVKLNIDETIGEPYELLIYNNSVENRPLTEVYNVLSEKAIFPFIIFMHEDILFRTNSWGRQLRRIFTESSISLIGVAGSKYKSSSISGWYSGIPDLNYFNIAHLTDGKEFILKNPKVWNSSETEVLTIDGVFMACRKSVCFQVRFDDLLFRGFHFYDIDFSFRVSMISKLVVTESISILHETKGGDFGTEWLKYAFVFSGKHKNYLPKSIFNVDISSNEKFTRLYWSDYLKNQRISIKDKFKYIIHEKGYFQVMLWYSYLKLFLYRPLSLNKLHLLIKSIKKS